MARPSEPDSGAPETSASSRGQEALCLRCGVSRRLASRPCAACGHVPVSLDDRAAHFLVLELSPDQREHLASKLRAGGTFAPDPDELERMKRVVDAATPLAIGWTALWVGGLPWLLVVASLFAVAWGLLAL